MSRYVSVGMEMSLSAVQNDVMLLYRGWNNYDRLVRYQSINK